MKNLILVLFLMVFSVYAMATSVTITLTTNNSQIQDIARLDSANKSIGVNKVKNYLDALQLGAQVGTVTVKVGTNGTRTYRFGK